MSKLSEARRQPLADKELRVLEEIAGQRICEQSGAAYNVALETLISAGYVSERWYGNFPPKRELHITPAGRKALEDN